MKVSYNGFTGELVKLEVTTNIKGTLRINGVDYSNTGVNLKDVKFLGGSVSFE